MTDALASLKQEAGIKAVEFVQSGMRVGLGTGSTAIFATRRIAEFDPGRRAARHRGLRHLEGDVGELCVSDIPTMRDDLPYDLDIAIDGADEVDPELNLIKGGGGALLREKIVAQASRREVIVVDDTKLSPRLGTRSSLPVEVLTFGWRSQARFLESLGAIVAIRRADDDQPFVTDSGNTIIDCRFGPIADGHALAATLDARAGIVGHGLLIGLTHDLIVASASGVEHRSSRGSRPSDWQPVERE